MFITLRKHSLYLIALPALFLFSCGSDEDNSKNKKNQTPAIEGYVVKPQPLEENIEVSGTIVPMDEVALMPEISGRITHLNLPEGQHVSRGTLLVKLFDADLQADLQKLDSQLKSAKTTESRQKELLKVNGISQQEYDLAVLQITSLEADMAAVRAQISKTEIRAPFDGIIGLRKISEGAYVSPGTEIAMIRSDGQLKIDFSISESYAGRISKGQTLDFAVDGDTNVYHAEVMATEKHIDAGTLNMLVRASVKEKSTNLLPGASAIVSVSLGGKEQALMVPTQAVIPQARFKNIIVCKNGKATMVKVTTGIRHSADVEIVSGLNAGDTIVTTGIQFVRPGSPLRFTSVK